MLVFRLDLHSEPALNFVFWKFLINSAVTVAQDSFPDASLCEVLVSVREMLNCLIFYC